MNASDHAPAGQSDVLRSAWKRMVELDLQSSKLNKQSIQLRKWIAILGVVATFLAIITNELRDEVYEVIEQILRGLLILVPIAISVIAAYSNKFFGGANGFVMRAGTEEIKKEIYLFRTVLRNHPERDKWLSRRLTTIQRRTYKSLGGELIIDAYEGKLPKYYNPDDPNSDPGFTDLTGDEYMRYRVIDQRDWHRNKIVKLKAERIRIQLIILVMGGFGALLAAVPPEWTPGWGLASWVALTAAIASAYTGWEQLRGLDKILTIYSRVILELTIIRDEWEAIAPHQRTEVDFVNMVRMAEDVMWAQNMQYISTMQEAITAGQGDEAELVENMLKEGDSMTADLQAKLLEEARGVMTLASVELGKVVEESAATMKGMVGTVTSTATALQQSVQETVEVEMGAIEDLVGGGLERVTVETAAFRETAQSTVDIALTEAAATRAAVEITTETVAAQAGAIRETVQDTVIEQAAATRATVETTAETVTVEAEAIRETVQDTITEQATATSEMVETASQAISTEAEALRQTAQATLDTALAESAAGRETAEIVTEALSTEAAAVRQTVETSVEVAVSESTNLRETSLAQDKVGEIRDMMEEKITTEVKKYKKDNEAKLSAKLDAMLDEAAEVIGTATDTMRDKMAEEVAEKIVDVATDRKKTKPKEG